MRLLATRKHVRQHSAKPIEKELLKKKNLVRWVEALIAVEKQFEKVEKHFRVAKQHLEVNSELIAQKTRIIHVFDREGDIAEVFDCVRQMERTGVLVRAAHDRRLNLETNYLWEHLSVQPIQFYQEVDLPETAKRQARRANLALRFGQVQLCSPRRLKNQEPFEVYAVYDQEIEPKEGEEAVSWMLLTTETVTNPAQAATILRWYTYRWHIEISQPQCHHKPVNFYFCVP